MKSYRSISLLVVIGILLVVNGLCLGGCQSTGSSGDLSGSSAPESGLTRADVIRVVDGDTLIVDINGQEERLRLIGVNTPETDKSPQGAQPGGEEASAYTRSRLEGETVELEFDQDRYDSYDRALAYVWLDGELYNEELVEAGWAEARAYPPNTRYQDRLDQAEIAAQQAESGIWGNAFAQ